MSKESKKILGKKRLGEILKSLDFIDDEKLENILQEHKGSKMKLGEMLSSMGYVDKEVVLSIVGKQIGTPYIKVSEYGDIPQGVLNYIPKNIAAKHMLIPFEIENNVIKVAMAEPQEEEIRTSISVLTDMEVEAYITSEEEIIDAINSNYPA